AVKTEAADKEDSTTQAATATISGSTGETPALSNPKSESVTTTTSLTSTAATTPTADTAPSALDGAGELQESLTSRAAKDTSATDLLQRDAGQPTSLIHFGDQKTSLLDSLKGSATQTLLEKVNVEPGSTDRIKSEKTPADSTQAVKTAEAS